MTIDSHAHCFPDSLAPRALSKLETDEALHPRSDGTLEGLLSILDRDGIDQCFVLNIATNAHQQDKVNEFAVSINHYQNRVYAFGSIHPDYPNIKKAAKEIKEAGLYGVKLHPDFMGYDICDDKFKQIFASCAEYDLPVVIHAGLDPTSRTHIHAKPEDIAKILTSFPSLRLCAAHFGDVSNPESVIRHLCGKNIWFDTSFPALGATLSGVKKIFECHDINKIMFGSDMPWESPSEVMAFLAKLEFDDEQKKKLLGENAKHFLKI